MKSFSRGTMKRFSSECPVWGPDDQHNFHDEDDGHELAACDCGVPNPTMQESDGPPYVLVPGDDPFF